MAKTSEFADLMYSGRAPREASAFEFNLGSEHKGLPTSLPERLSAFRIRWPKCPLECWPAGWTARQEIDLSNSPALRSLPDDLSVSVLNVQNCTRLTALPRNLRVDFLNISGCVALRHWPDSARVTAGHVAARDCSALENLPPILGPISSLDISGCQRIDRIPEGVDVRTWIDVARTSLNSLPESLRGVGLRWRGVRVDARIAFFPEQLGAQEAMEQPNAEVRRVIIERMGFERFLKESGAVAIHEDRDAGGLRRLYSVELPGDEPLVVVSVICPSTGRHYLIRVPPTMRTCRQAVAWTAGFDNEADYQPLAET